MFLKLIFMKKSSTIRIYLITLVIIFFISSLSLLLLLYYMDPETNLSVAIVTISVASFLTICSIITILIYFIKKIYYRWEMFLSYLNSSLRQWIFLSVWIIWTIVFYSIWVYNIKTIWLLLFTLILVELVFQTISDD